MSFSEFIAEYPRHEARAAAERAYNAALKQTTHEEIMLRLRLYKSTEWAMREIDAISNGRRRNSFYPLAATFLRREDWWERTEALADEEPVPTLRIVGRAHKHWCKEHRHVWECADEVCPWPGHAVCAEEKALQKAEKK